MKKDLEKKWPSLRQTMKKVDCSQPQLATPSLPPHFSSLSMIFWRKELKRIIEIDEKRLRKKVALIKTNYEEGRLQPTPAGHRPAGHPTLPLSPRYFEKKNSKKISEIDEKWLRKKWPWLRQTMQKGDYSQTTPQLATPLFLSPQYILREKIQKKS
jgi:hypothetical protein